MHNNLIEYLYINMDSSIVITDTPTLTGSSISDTITAKSIAPSSSTSSSVSSNGKYGNIIRYVLIGAVLLFLAVNLFSYLGKKSGILGLFGDTVKQTANNTAKGTKGVVNTGANVIDSGVNLLEKGAKEIVHGSSKAVKSGIHLLEKGIDGKNGKKKRNKIDDKTQGTGQALNDAVKKYKNPPPAPIPDDAGSRTQSNKAVGKSGYCYIGEDRGFRSCIQVNETDTCMSGDIFPTRDICINPNLRE